MSPAPRQRSARCLARLVVGVAVVVLVGTLGTGVAAADAARPTNFESVIDEVEPDLDRVDVRIVGGDAFVQVTADPGTEVLIPGYDGEPYLRIGSDGVVLRNRRSSATYLNESRDGTVDRLPDRVDSSADPDWERIGDGGVVAWHDHRVHWMLDAAPETGDGVVQQWTVPMTVDDTEVVVSGRLLVRDDRFPWPAVVGVAVAALVAWRARSSRARTLVLATASTVALVSSLAWYTANPPGASPSVLALVLPALALVATLVARAMPPSLRHLAMPLAAVALLAGWFVQRIGVLWMPTLPITWSDPLERVLGASVAGAAVGVAIAVLVRPYPDGAAPGQTAQDRSSSSSSASQSSVPPRS